MSRSSSFLTSPIEHVLDLMITWTRVHAISAVLIESDARHASTSPAKGKTCVGHSPTRKKYRDTARLNRGAQLSINCVTAPPILPRSHYTCGPSICELPQATVTPLTSVRVASCHASAPPAPRAGHLGSATWPQCRVAPQGGPARHGQHLQLPLATSASAANNPFSQFF